MKVPVYAVDAHEVLEGFKTSACFDGDLSILPLLIQCGIYNALCGIDDALREVATEIATLSETLKNKADV